MITAHEFGPELARLLPETSWLLEAAGLVLHPAVAKVSLHGSRGLLGSYRPNSDIDLSLIVDSAQLSAAPDPDLFLDQVLHVTLDNWSGPVELDLAAIFDEMGCGLACLEQGGQGGVPCRDGGKDCFRVYKDQKGFHGFVRGVGIEVRRMLPCLVIWRKSGSGAGGA